MLKAQELINSAKVKNLATDFKNIPVFIYGYQDKFRAVPGDDPKADINLPAGGVKCGAVGTATATCNPGNGLIDGPWDSADITGTVESQLFWQHVRLAGLAPGPTLATADLLPTNSVGGVIGITSLSSFTAGDPTVAPNLKLTGTYVICSAGILGKFAKQLDLQMDDGSPVGGSIREFSQAGRGAALTMPTLTNNQIDDNLSFTVCMGV